MERWPSEILVTSPAFLFSEGSWSEKARVPLYVCDNLDAPHQPTDHHWGLQEKDLEGLSPSFPQAQEGWMQLWIVQNKEYICIFDIFVLFCFFIFFPSLYKFFLFYIFFINWRLITLQYCRGFCHTLTWISHGFTCVPHPDPPSRLPLHPIPLGLPSAPGPSACLMIFIEAVSVDRKFYYVKIIA